VGGGGGSGEEGVSGYHQGGPASRWRGCEAGRSFGWPAGGKRPTDRCGGRGRISSGWCVPVFVVVGGSRDEGSVVAVDGGVAEQVSACLAAWVRCLWQGMLSGFGGGVGVGRVVGSELASNMGSIAEAADENGEHLVC
jgi:hypothetical protein